MHCGHNVVLNDDMPSDEKRYSITRVIKRGGQGSVYQGTDQHGRIYAIKEMLDDFIDPKERAEATRRFEAEASILKGLSHPRIPRIYSHFTDEGRHYLTMDFVRGNDLDHLLDQQGALPEAQALEWAQQICDVLDYLHTRGLVYRDVKPSNIMIDEQGNMKLVDFGIAKVFNPAERGGTQIGTPGYAPPEQYQGLATPASDIYALGATLHHMVTGRDPTEEPPFSFPPARTVQPAISQRTSDALERALKMKPEERFPTIRAFAAALRPTVPTSRQARVASSVPAGGRAAAAYPRSAPPAPGGTGRLPIPPSAPPRSSSSSPAPPPSASSQRGPAPYGLPPAAQQPQTPPRRQGFGSFLLRLLIGMIVLAVALVVMLVVLIGVIGFGVEAGPTHATPAGLQPPRMLPLEVEAAVPAGADEEAIRSALREAYRAQVAATYPGAVINENASISSAGSIEHVGEENDMVRYRATMQGFAALPQGP
jgi:serine/threonine-protein kinase